MGLEGGLSALVSMSGSISETGGGGADVSYTEVVESGTLLGVLSIDDHNYGIYAPEGGTDVSYDPELQSGTLIGTLTIDEVEYPIYAPSGGGGGGSEVSFTQTLGSGTKIGTITIDNTPTDIYAPTPDIISYTNNVSAIGKEKIGTIKINGVDNDVYVREVDCTTTWTANLDGYDLNINVGDNTYKNYVPNKVSGLLDVNIYSPTNGQVLKYDSTSSKWINATGGSGGSTVTITPVYNSGLKVADYSIDGVTGSLYIPKQDLVNTNATNVKEIYNLLYTEGYGYHFTIAPGSGYEGLTYRIINTFTPDHTYKISFYFTNSATGSWQTQYPWRCAIEDTNVSNYNVTAGEINLPKQAGRYLIELTFTATQATHYLVFYLSQLTTSGSYPETIDSFTIEDITTP